MSEYSILENSYGCRYCLMKGENIIGAVSGNVAGFFVDDIIPELEKLKALKSNIVELEKENERLKEKRLLQACIHCEPLSYEIDKYRNALEESIKGFKDLRGCLSVVSHLDRADMWIERASKALEEIKGGAECKK